MLFCRRAERAVITQKPKDLDSLDARIAAAQDKRPKPKVDDNSGSMLGMAWRLSTEMIVSVLVGMGLGFGIDYFLNTNPWFMLVGVGFGFAAGIRNTLRLAAKMDALDADIPLGDDIGFDDDDDED